MAVVETAIQESQYAANEHKGSMESQYDSTKEEAQMMVMAQSKRKAVLLENQILLQKILDNHTLLNVAHNKIQIASIFTLMNDNDNASTYIISPILGGESLEVEGQVVTALSPTSPLGIRVMHKECDDDITWNIQGVDKQYYISSVC